MLRATTYVMAVLVLIALGIGVRQWFFSDLDQAAQHGTRRSVKELAAAGSHIEPVAPSSGLSVDSRDEENTKPKGSQDPSFAGNESSVSAFTNRPTVTPQQNTGTDPQYPANVDTLESEAMDSDAVIGRPFPVSDSVEAHCKTNPFGSGEDSPCYRVHQKLSMLAQEPRDAAWATNMEAKMENSLMEDPSKCTIRAIECRTSVCAVECASLYGASMGLDYEFTRDNRLRVVDHMWGYETDPAGARVTVTVIAYTRR